jgi:hypothetical protein
MRNHEENPDRIFAALLLFVPFVMAEVKKIGKKYTSSSSGKTHFLLRQ